MWRKKYDNRQTDAWMTNRQTVDKKIMIMIMIIKNLDHTYWQNINQIYRVENTYTYDNAMHNVLWTVAGQKKLSLSVCRWHKKYYPRITMSMFDRSSLLIELWMKIKTKNSKNFFFSKFLNNSIKFIVKLNQKDIILRRITFTLSSE